MAAQPAFPLHPGINPDMGDGIYNGMTLRDWFAGQAAPAYLASADIAISNGTLSLAELCGRVALCSYQFADAMLAERAKAGDQ
jgi:hypothetical protein